MHNQNNENQKNTEIELKLITNEQTLLQIKQHSLFKNHNWLSENLHSTYFDDINHTLAKNKMALRIRCDDSSNKNNHNNQKNIIQTLKITHLSENGLSKRDEFEHNLNAFKLDLEPIKQHLPNDISELNPLFSTVFKREKCHFNWQNSIVEIALDVGKIRIIQPNNKANPTIKICEIELELLKGNTNDVINLADKLISTFNLQKNDISKAQRGFKLLNNSN